MVGGCRRRVRPYPLRPSSQQCPRDQGGLPVPLREGELPLRTVLVVVLAMDKHEGDIHQGTSPWPCTPSGHEHSFLFEVPFATPRLLVLLGVINGPSPAVPAPPAVLTVPFGPPTEGFLWVGFLTVGARDVVVMLALFGWRL